MKVKVQVTQRHIEIAKAGTLYTREEPYCCPIALALFEQVARGSVRLIRRQFALVKRQEIAFDLPGGRNSGNLFSVAESIIWRGYGLPGQKNLHPPHHTRCSNVLRRFVADFDSGAPVEPFEFEYTLPSYQ